MVLLKRSRCLTNKSGVAAIEFALILPLFIALMIAILEFGLYFTKQHSVSRAVNNISNAIQTNAPGTVTQADANAAGSETDTFNSPNYFCAKSYPSRHQAMASCTSGWDTSPPPVSTVPQPGEWAPYEEGQVYYVALAAHVKYKSLTPLADYIPDLNVKNVIMVTPATQNRTQQHGMIRLGRTVVPYSNVPANRSALSGTWEKPEGVKSVKITLVGGGGSGSGINTLAGNYLKGGTSGAVTIYYISNLPNARTTYNYSTGAGATGVINAAQSSGTVSTVFGTLSSDGTGSLTLPSTPSDGTPVIDYKVYFPPNQGGYRSGTTDHPDVVWYNGGLGASTPLGLGQGGMASTHDDQVLSLDAQGWGSGGAGQSTHAGPDKRPGHGAPGMVLVEW